MKKPVMLIMISSLVVPLMLSAWGNNSSTNASTGRLFATVTQPNMDTRANVNTKAPSQVDNSQKQVPTVADDFTTLSEVQKAIKGLSKNYNINIRILDGNVTLSGTVDSTFDKQNIERTVKTIPGVTKVTNQLQVTSGVTSTN
jgi:osmotically-inducible protein OsmY